MPANQYKLFLLDLNGEWYLQETDSFANRKVAIAHWGLSAGGGTWKVRRA